MKHTKLNLLICTLVIFCILNYSIGLSLRYQKGNKLSKKSNKQVKKVTTTSESQKGPVSAKDLKNSIYTQNQNQPSEVEQNPNGYNQVSPFTSEQQEKLFPKKLYSKDNSTYNMNEATPSNIGNAKILLVKNMTAAKEQFKDSKFFDGKQQLDPIAQSLIDEQNQFKQQVDQRFPVKHNDQEPYYNPIDDKNIFKPNDNGLYVVPINLQQQPQDSEEYKEFAERKRLAHRDSYYYDASAIYDVPTSDPLKKRLEQQAKLNAQPKAVQLNEWVKKEQEKKNNIQAKLGNPIVDPAVQVKSNFVNNNIKKLDNDRIRKIAEANPLPPIKANEKEAYYKQQ